MQPFSTRKIRLEDRKSTKNTKTVRIAPPERVYIPTKQHIGTAAIPIVKKGDRVSVGTLIAEADGYMSVPVHSSVSGTVREIDQYLFPSGERVPMIVIDSDKLMTKDQSLTPPIITDQKSLSDAARSCGLVGLGGAGFPTAVKLDPSKINSVDTLIVNAAECEPYITADTRTMIEDGEDVIDGIALIMKYSKISSAVIAIEKSNASAIEKMRSLIPKSKGVSLKILKPDYPEGAEKLLVYNTCKRVIPKGAYSIDVGVMVMNVSTVKELSRYIKSGVPLVEKTVSIDGSAIKNPSVLKVPIGTPVRELIEAAGGLRSEAGKILYGGPMTGIALYSSDAPILKYTNAVTVLNKKDSEGRRLYPCINCGRCGAYCPIGLEPTAYAKALNIDEPSERARILIDAQLELCIECGVCSYVCPSARPLVEMNRLGKLDVRKYRLSESKE